jgi:hypothetical protein
MIMYEYDDDHGAFGGTIGRGYRSIVPYLK